MPRFGVRVHLHDFPADLLGDGPQLLDVTRFLDRPLFNVAMLGVGMKTFRLRELNLYLLRYRIIR